MAGNQNLTNLEAALRGLKSGQTMTVDYDLLRRVFGLDADGSVTKARELAKRQGCSFTHDPEQGLGRFKRSDGGPS